MFRVRCIGFRVLLSVCDITHDVRWEACGGGYTVGDVVDVFVRHCSGACMQGPVGLQGWLGRLV